MLKEDSLFSVSILPARNVSLSDRPEEEWCLRKSTPHPPGLALDLICQRRRLSNRTCRILPRYSASHFTWEMRLMCWRNMGPSVWLKTVKIALLPAAPCFLAWVCLFPCEQQRISVLWLWFSRETQPLPVIAQLKSSPKHSLDLGYFRHFSSRSPSCPIHAN